MRTWSISTCGRVILNRPDDDAIAPLARRDGDPVFDEPWQAQALGLAISLSERGVFSPAAWSAELGAAHRQLIAGGAADSAQTYYEAVTMALERLLSSCGALGADAIEARSRDWRQAYLNTPHGEPVELAASVKDSKPENRGAG